MIRWLRLKDATKYSLIGKARLIELALAGTIKGAQDPDSGRRDWIFDKLSIDAYREGQMAGQDARQKAIAIMSPR